MLLLLFGKLDDDADAEDEDEDEHEYLKEGKTLIPHATAVSWPLMMSSRVLFVMASSRTADVEDARLTT